CCIFLFSCAATPTTQIDTLSLHDALPIFGYLKVDTSTYERFKAGYVSGAYRGPTRDEDDTDEPLALPYPAYGGTPGDADPPAGEDRKSTRLNSSHVKISYAVFCLKKKKQK